jgi:hypothetical protein
MGGRRIAAIALSGALVAGGTGAAIAAVSKDDAGRAEQEVLDDAAKRLGVTSDKLRDALSAAQDAQLDKAVKDGDLTQKQADGLKAMRKESGSVLGGPRGLLKLHGGPHPFGRGKGLHGGPVLAGPKAGVVGDLADALGVSTVKLFEQLRDGKSIADVAKAQGKSLDSVRSSVKAAAKKRFDKAVADGDLTRKQADRMLEHLGARLENLDAKRGLLPRRHRFGGDEMPAPPGLERGRFELRDAPPEPVPVPGVFF